MSAAKIKMNQKQKPKTENRKQKTENKRNGSGAIQTTHHKPT